MATIIAYLVATAVAALVLSLPLGKTRAGSVLRRVAVFCAILAFLPAIVVSIVTVPSAPGGAGTTEVGCGAESLVALAILSLAAWAFFVVRRSLSPQGRETKRGAMLRRYRHRVDDNLREFLDWFNRGDRDA